MPNLRYAEYYGMTEIFDDLYARSQNGENFDRLYDIITNRENILLAYRTIKSNEGSVTPGVDGVTIKDIQRIPQDKLVELIQKRLKRYQPYTVRRVFIPKESGNGERPLGIPCMIDRIIQQAFKQVLEPICEARFYKHSYGFRPLRSAHHALARVQFLINQAGLHYVVDIDIKGFFDNVNHRRLMKQLWNMGIQDRQVLRIISKMIKAPIEGGGIPDKGTPQGGIISSLLSNIVLNDLDQWIAGQWENFPAQHEYSRNDNKYHALKNSRLKEGYIVRYADDFKILCRDWKTAQKWYHAVRLYLKDRLKLDISPEKSQIVNLRKRKSEFLGFTIKAARKGKKRVAHTGIKDKKKQQIKKQLRQLIHDIQKKPDAQSALRFNSFVRGIHEYFKYATHVNIEMSKIAFQISRKLYNRLRSIGRYEHPSNPPPSYTKYYSTNYRTFKIGNVYLYPVADVRTVNNMNFTQTLTPYTEAGRSLIHKRLDALVHWEIIQLMNSRLPNSAVEYMDNRLSRYSMTKGRCEVTGWFLPAQDVHCHHVIPMAKGGTDEYNNLRIIHKDIHVLIHMTNETELEKRLMELQLDDKSIRKLKQYRNMVHGN